MRFALVVAFVAGCSSGSSGFATTDATALSDQLTAFTKDIVDDTRVSFLNPDVTTIVIDHPTICIGGGSFQMVGKVTGTSMADGGDGIYTFDVTTTVDRCHLSTGLVIDAVTDLVTSGTISPSGQEIAIANLIFIGELTGDGARCKVDLTVELEDPGPKLHAAGLVCGTSIDKLM